MEEPRNLGKTTMPAESEWVRVSDSHLLDGQCSWVWEHFKSYESTISSGKMANDIENQLDNLSVLSPKRCIYRVPERLRQVNEKAYTPQVVSIGPLHHGKEPLKAMEEHKLRYLGHFRSRTKVSLSDYIQKIQDQEKKLRGFYAEPIVFGKDEFVRIVSVDAAFVIEVLLRFHYSSDREENDDYIFSKPTMMYDVIRDLKLLENQLPFFILQVLFTLFPCSLRLPSLLQFSYELFQSEIDSKGKEEKFGKICSSGVEVQHFVDLIRILYLPLESKTTAAPNITATATATSKGTAIPNVTELHQAGVKIKVGKGSSLFDIKFSRGILGICRILEIPKLRVDDYTDLTLRNLLAFEQCHHGGKEYLANYVFFMTRLVKSSNDVQLLVETEIIENWLVDTEKVNTLLRDLGTGMRVDDSHYAPLCEELKKYREKRWPKWMVILKQNYFNSPWSTISVAAAVILLGLTVVQTVYSIKSVP